MANPSGSVADRDVTVDSAGAASGKSGKKWYLRPSRTDIRVNIGGTWTPWPYNPDAAVGHEWDIEATTNNSGEFALPLWFTDTEVDVPDAATSPPVVWNVINNESERVWFGPLPSSVGAGAYTLKQLLSLASPNTWQESGTVNTANPAGRERHVSVTFTSSSQDRAVDFGIDMGGADWKFTAGAYTDADFRMYTVACKSGTKTATGATFRLSDLPVVGKDVTVDLRIWR